MAKLRRRTARRIRRRNRKHPLHLLPMADRRHARHICRTTVHPARFRRLPRRTLPNQLSRRRQPRAGRPHRRPVGGRASRRRPATRPGLQRVGCVETPRPRRRHPRRANEPRPPPESPRPLRLGGQTRPAAQRRRADCRRRQHRLQPAAMPTRARIWRTNWSTNG